MCNTGCIPANVNITIKKSVKLIHEKHQLKIGE